MTIHPARTLAVSIDRPAREVYDFVRNPEHLPTWAPGFTSRVHRDGDTWIADTTVGQATVEFAPENEHLIADHLVTVPDGTQTLNPIRVLENGDGAEVIFTVVREDGQSDETYAEILNFVETDLALLKKALDPDS